MMASTSLSRIAAAIRSTTARTWRSAFSAMGIAQLWMEIPASFRREVEHVPQRVEQVVVAIFLAGLGRHIEQLGPPAVADDAAVAMKHVQHRHVPLLAVDKVLLLA